MLFQQHAVQTSDYLVEWFPSHSCFMDEDFLLLRSIDQRQAPPPVTMHVSVQLICVLALPVDRFFNSIAL